MRLELTGRHVGITPALRRLVDTKVAKLERVLNDGALSAQAVLTEEKNRHRTDITLHARGERFLHGSGAASTWDTSVSQAIAKLAQQAKKIKGKRQGRKRRGARRSGAPVPVGETAREAATRPAGVSIPRVRMPRIFRAERQVVRSMSIAEAAREIGVNGAGIVVFRDTETAAVSVLYQRDGELTLLRTEA